LVLEGTPYLGLSILWSWWIGIYVENCIFNYLKMYFIGNENPPRSIVIVFLF
jgi:hypothetical protein